MTNKTPTNRKSPKRRAVFGRDTFGKSIALIPLSDGTNATIDRKSYDHLIRNGVTDQWTVMSDGDNRDYVRCRHRGKLTTVSRLILNASPNTMVVNKSGKCRDLRKSNLIIKPRKKPLS